MTRWIPVRPASGSRARAEVTDEPVRTWQVVVLAVVVAIILGLVAWYTAPSAADGMRGPAPVEVNDHRTDFVG